MPDIKEFTIDGQNMQSREHFYDEVARVLCPEFKHFGRNLDAFNDILRGGFKAFDLGESIILHFINKKKAIKNLGEGFIKKIENIILKNENVEYKQ